MKTLASVLLVPGLYDSGPEHWQSIWHARHPEYHRVQQEDWETPRCSDWVRTLHRAICDIGNPVVLAAHSLGCATVAHYVAKHPDESRIVGAFLVAPTDVEASTFPSGTSGFLPMPLHKLPFRSLVVASGNDPYLRPDRAAYFAGVWGSRLISIGNAGHINSASGHGAWPEGETWLEEMRAIPA